MSVRFEVIFDENFLFGPFEWTIDDGAPSEAFRRTKCDHQSESVHYPFIKRIFSAQINMLLITHLWLFCHVKFGVIEARTPELSCPSVHG